MSVSTYLDGVGDEQGEQGRRSFHPITRCFKSCTRLGVSDRSDAKPAQPADRDRETAYCLCCTDRMA